MTLTMEISPNAEAHLRLLAAQQGEEENSLAARMLMDLLEEDEADLQQSVAAVRAGLTDLAAGDRGILLQEYRAQIQDDRQPSSSEAAA